MTTATKNHLEIALINLRREALEAGLMAEDDKLIYDKGNRVNGISGELWLGREGTRASFVPRFTLRNTQREHILMMESATTALRAARLFRVCYDPRCGYTDGHASPAEPHKPRDS